MPNARRLVLVGTLAATLVTAACTSTTSGEGAATGASGAPTGFPSSAGSASTGTSASALPSSTNVASPTSPSSPSSTRSRSTGAGATLSRATLSRALLRTGDLPSGWTAKKPDSANADDTASNRQLANCLGDPSLVDDHHLLDINGTNFSKGTTQLSSEAESYPSAAAVARQVAEVENPRFETCLQKTLRTAIGSSLPSGARIARVVLKLVKPPTGTSTNLLGIASGVVIVRTSGGSLPIFILDAFITGRRLTTSVEAFSDGTPLDSALIGTLVKAVASRAGSI